MSFEWKVGSGGLFLHRGNGPKFKGEINIDGKIIKLAGWEKQTKNGDPWYSLSVDTFVPKARTGSRMREAPPPADERDYSDYDDKIPF